MNLVLVLVSCVALYAALKGDQPERWCAVIMAGGVLLDFLLLTALGPRSFTQFDASRITLDIVQVTGFIWVAQYANRVYPIYVAAAQLVSIFGSLSAILVNDGMSLAFWAMTQTPLFAQMAFLSGGISAHQKRVSVVGTYNSWSPKYSDQGEVG